MMRVYVVPDEAIRAAGFAPNRSLRFPAGSYEPVADPRAADVILPGVDLFALKSREEFLRVPCVREHEARTAHFDCADNYAAYKSTAILVRGNLSRERLADSPNSVAWPWPTEDFRAHGVQAATPGAFSHDVGFHGWDYSDTCKAAIQSCQRTFGERFDLAAYHDFAGYLWKDGKPLPEFTRRREGFVASLARCRVQLCAESIPGVLRYRVTETMSAGRVPVIVGTGAVLPWADEVPWREVVVFIEASDAGHAGERIAEFLARTPDDVLARMGERGREAWLRWLDVRHAEKGPALMHEAIERKARALGLVGGGR